MANGRPAFNVLWRVHRRTMRRHSPDKEVSGRFRRLSIEPLSLDPPQPCPSHDCLTGKSCFFITIVALRFMHGELAHYFPVDDLHAGESGTGGLRWRSMPPPSCVIGTELKIFMECRDPNKTGTCKNDSCCRPAWSPPEPDHPHFPQTLNSCLLAGPVRSRHPPANLHPSSWRTIFRRL